MKGLNYTDVGKSEEAQDLLIPAEGYIAASIALFLIGMCGFFFNLFVMVLMWKNKQLWTPLNVILFNVVCSDFLVSILGNPWTFISALSYTWIFGHTMCVVYGFIMSLLGITSITTLTVLAFERYMMIARPFRNGNLSHRTSIILIVGVWGYSLALTSPPLFGWGEYVLEGAKISCSVNWEQQTLNSMTYIVYLFTFGLFIPLAVIIFSYVNIILTMRKTTFRMGRVTKAEGKVAYMVLVMIMAFLVAWSPYALLALIIQFGDASFVTPGVAVWPALLAKSSICYNPVIYVGLNPQFKQTWKQLISEKRMYNSSCETYCMATSKFISQDPITETRRIKSKADKSAEVLMEKQTDITKV